MVYNNVVLKVNAVEDVDTVRAALVDLAKASRSEPGCERFEVHHSRTSPDVFLLIETWLDAAALDAHRSAHAFTQIYQPRVLPLVERAPHDCELVY